MPVEKRKESPRKKRREKAPFPIGRDGKTANQRMREAMAWHSTLREEAPLVEAVNRILGRSPGDKGYVLQQTINNYIRDEDSLARGRNCAVIAEALEVRAVWLQDGIGPPKDERGELFDRLLRAAKDLPAR